MKLYVINLDRSPERLARLEIIFAKLQLKPTRIPAIDARKLSEQEYEELTAQSLWPEPLTRGEIACFSSHREAIKRIAEDGDPFGAVFEDDILLAREAAFFLKTDEWVPWQADIVKLETFNKKIWLGEKQPTKLPGFFTARLNSTHIMAAAYIISREAAQRLLSEMQYATAPFDHWLFNFNLGIAPGLKIYQLDPAIAIQEEMISTLEEERASNESKKKNNRTWFQTLKRETIRLFRRARTGIWGIGINCLTKEQWKRIPFAGNEDSEKDL